ncbi:efflux RND transporter periplasmic adaptor subunit [Desulfobacter postgatei]|jgi:membrane fusion protein (multidrug efflux system)|uniref:efflux RND transporter periplasmic adaptor subunit n=1 Tax=Desulfobacter TaxID=2289 RepID=UPI002A361DE4|nr:efflux RND transporter periplasmic adaptor subunit [Desulfobacter postgatei]MDX9962278.1 efflux RND transporter periplasmic adaptor subunit [Desulfobacter postgatei]
MKRFLLGFITAVLIGGGFLYFSGQLALPWAGEQKDQAPASAPQTSAQAGPPVEVAVYTVKPQEVVFTKDLAGRTSAYQVAEIRPQVTGIILKRMFTQGSLVTKGQQLYQIDPATYKAEYESASASLVRAQADVKAVEPKLARYSRLVKMGGVSRQVYDDTEAALAQSRADVAVAQANLAAAKINLDYTKVFSPISGRIGKSSVTEGALVTANQTTALAVLQNLDQIYVDVNQSSEELMALKKGLNNPEQNSMVSLFIGKEGIPYDLQGKLLFSDATVDQSTGMVQLRILFPNPEKELLPGLFVRARVAQFRQDNAIVVPQQAVVRNADGSVYVWVVDKENTVKYQIIKVFQAVKDQWVVSSGLAPGDRIVVEGLQKIRPQAKVSTVEYKASTNS